MDTFLVEPTQEYKREYLEMIAEWRNTKEKMVPFVLRSDPTDYETFLMEMEDLKTGRNLTHLKVKSSTFWLVRSDRTVLGAVNVRHELSQRLLEVGGHIGYGIRPSERKKGYASRILALGLEEARKLGIRRVLVTCDKENTGSAKTIMKNGGVLESEADLDGIPIERYWIELD